MNQINIMDASGHSKFKWDPQDQEQVKAARETFDAWKAKGYRVFRAEKGGELGARLETFDPTAKKMIVVPQLVGG